MLIIYTNTFRRAETILYDGHSRSQHIYNYQTNEVYVIEKGECHVEKLNETTALNMFGLVMKPDGVEEMKPAEYVLFFNNGVPHVWIVVYTLSVYFISLWLDFYFKKKIGTTTKRGIPVTQYRSCQSLPNGDSFSVDYFFKQADYPVGVSFDEIYKEIPIAAIFQGYNNVDMVTGQFTPFYNEYNFYEFRTGIERLNEVLNVNPSFKFNIK